MADPMTPRLDEALRGMERGWVFTPLRGKIPVLEAWQKAPPPSREDLEAWVASGNIGLRTGAVSGIVVIDDDTPDGSGSRSLDLPPTATVITGSGKRHLYFRAPDFRVRNSVKGLAADVDVRGDGGQVVFLGSVHPDTHGVYRWAPGLSPDEVEIAELPEHIVDKLRPKSRKQPDTPPWAATNGAPRQSSGSGKRERAYADAALRSAVDKVSTAAEHTRNNTLFQEAITLGQLVGSGLLTEAEVVEVLTSAASNAGLGDQEIRATIQSGLRKGLAEPRLPKEDAPCSPAKKDDRPLIRVHAGFLPKSVQRAERLLRQRRPHAFYQRGTGLIRLLQLPMPTRRITSSMVVMHEADVPFLVQHLTEIIRWERFDKRSGEYVLIDCPEKVARTILSRVGKWKLPHLLGIITTPTLRADGSVLDTPGYDAATGLYLAPGDVKFDPIPDRPTREEAMLACDFLLAPLAKFPWLEEADRSVALAAILTALIRPSLRTAPLFAFRAPKMGSGKSLLADCVSLIATGRPAAVMTQGDDENEDRKRILAILLEGDPVACIDNVEKPFGSTALCAVLTSQTWRDRVLGKSQTAVVPTTNTTWLATGNNIQFVGDITTRVVVCDLDPRCERPEERKFDVNLHKYLPQHRGALVAAGLTMLRAHHVAGRPDQKLPVFGRFEEWSDWVRSTIAWLGLPDPCATRTRLSDADPVREYLRFLLQGLRKAFGSRPFTAAEAAGRKEVQAGLKGLVGEQELTAQLVGLAFRRFSRRLEGGLRLVRDGERSGSALWRVRDAG